MFKHITKIDGKILGLYVKDYTASYSIREIAQTLGINYSHTFNEVKMLVKEGYLLMTKMGQAYILALNILSYETIKMMAFVEQIASGTIKSNSIIPLIKEAMNVDLYACVGLFGSRVSGKARKESDWDFFIISEKRKEMEKIMSQFPYATNIQLHVFTLKEFWESLLSPEETVVKHIVRNKLILYNAFPFYNLIKNWELMKHTPQ